MNYFLNSLVCPNEGFYNVQHLREKLGYNFEPPIEGPLNRLFNQPVLEHIRIFFGFRDVHSLTTGVQDGLIQNYIGHENIVEVMREHFPGLTVNRKMARFAIYDKAIAVVLKKRVEKEGETVKDTDSTIFELYKIQRLHPGEI